MKRTLLLLLLMQGTFSLTQAGSSNSAFGAGSLTITNGSYNCAFGAKALATNCTLDWIVNLIF